MVDSGLKNIGVSMPEGTDESVELPITAMLAGLIRMYFELDEQGEKVYVAGNLE